MGIRIFSKPLSGPGKAGADGPDIAPPPSTPPWMRIALSEKALNVREIAGAAVHPRIKLYHSHTTLKATSDEVPWCSSFACFVMDTAGFKSTSNAAARSWWTWGQHITAPKYGAIAVLRRGGSRNPNDKGPGHVAFVITARPGFVTLLGGNQSDSITIQEFPVGDVFGYRWPRDYPLPK
jgi:uncharacterized protein (TIGR02594 family)